MKFKVLIPIIILFNSCELENQNLNYIQDCQEGYIVEQYKNQKAVIKKEGAKLYELNVDTVGCIGAFGTMATIVGKNNLFGILNANDGSYIEPIKHKKYISMSFQNNHGFRTQVFVFEDKEVKIDLTKYSIIEKDDKPKNNITSNDIVDLKTGFLVREKDGKIGFFKNDSTKITSYKFDNVNWFTDDDLCAVEIDGKLGFINKDGRFVINPKYKAEKIGASTSWSNFQNGLCPVTNDGVLWGYIDKSGKVIIDYKFKIAMPFSDGRAFIANFDNECFIINTNGKKLNKEPLSWGWVDSPHAWGWVTFKDGFMKIDKVVVNRDGEIVN